MLFEVNALTYCHVLHILGKTLNYIYFIACKYCKISDIMCFI